MTIVQRFARVAACALGVLFAGAAMAAGYPDKPIHLLVPYPPGGITDVLTRSLAELMRKELGQPMIVENRPGANTALAAQVLAASPPDGYTVMMAAAATVVMNPLRDGALGGLFVSVQLADGKVLGDPTRIPGAAPAKAG